MGKLHWNSVKSVGKRWRMGDYLRQFSIVVAGIIVTFWGSSEITDHTRQKEVNATLHLVAEEMEHNQKELKRIMNLMKTDKHMALLLAEHHLNISTLPNDTLQKYSLFFYNIENYDYTTDALDVLKGSSLMQYISDKRLLQNILQVYYQLSMAQKDINKYYQLKENAIMGYFLSVTKEQNIKYLKEPRKDESGMIRDILNTDLFADFTIHAPYYLNWDLFTSLNEELDKQILILQERVR